MTRGFFICPSPTPLGRAFSTILRHSDWEETSFDEARLVIVDHRDSSIQVRPEDLAFFHLRSPNGEGQTRRVLFLSPGDMYFRSGGGAGYHWLYACTQWRFSLQHFLAWLAKSSLDQAHPGAARPVRPLYATANCKSLLAADFASGQTGGGDPIRALLASLPVPTEVFDWFKSEDPSQLYYALLRICGNLDVLLHNEDRERAEIVRGSGDARRHVRIRAFLDRCEDIRQSMNCELHHPGAQTRILVIDDKPSRIQEELETVEEWIKPYEFWIWNTCDPASTPGALTLDGLCSYQSLSQHGRSRQVVPVRRLAEQEPKDHELHDLIARTRFILVDQLFVEEGGRHAVRGPAAIRGLRRLIRDLSSTPDWKATHQPQIVVLSRSPEPELIQRSLRAGALDYVPKDNAYRLPAVLARIQGLQRDPSTRYQGAFRRVRDLPNRVVGLLHSLSVPRIAYHGQGDARVGDSPVDPRERHRIAAFRRLLEPVPKADLHVHVGSCMSPEFLVAASLIGLLQQKIPSADLARAVSAMINYVGTGERRLDSVFGSALRLSLEFPGGADWINSCAAAARRQIKSHLRKNSPKTLRSVLHQELKVSDYLSEEEACRRLDEATDIDVAFLCLRHREGIEEPSKLSLDTLVRAYILVLAAIREGSSFTFDDTELLNWFRERDDASCEQTWAAIQQTWQQIRKMFYEEEQIRDDLGLHSRWAPLSMRRSGWQMPSDKAECVGGLSRLTLKLYDPPGEGELEFALAPIEYTLASGTRSKNLKAYLQGCEFSGSAHLRHPFLIHLYAQHVMHRFVDKGLMYVELRGSPDGYVNPDIGFSFPDASQCLVEAFSSAQAAVLAACRREDGSPGTWLPGCLFMADTETSGGDGEPRDRRAREKEPKNRWSWDHLRWRFALTKGDSAFKQRFPVKVGLILVGKRHKTTRQMILEAAGGAVLHQPKASSEPISATQFVQQEMARSQIVGFDLAGQETDFPPSLFSQEFQRLSRLHVPMTVHAGENASVQFIEDAVLELRARRIGHGLTLADDPRLMARVREERICIELCPVSNYQTSHFMPADSPGRHYPLKRLLDFGVSVCLNTDNPIISNTDIVKEFFQASYAMGASGLTLYDALRLIKAGFQHAFLPLPERRAMLELVDQILLDFFSNDEVVATLTDLAELSGTRVGT